MYSLILPRVSWQTRKFCKKTATSDNQMSGLSDIFSNSWRRLVQEFACILSSQPIGGLALKDGGTQTQKCGSCDENNTASSYCFVCQIFLCTACFEAHQRLRTTRGHRNVVMEKLKVQDVQELIHKPVMCSQQYHENQPLEFYCEECKVLICHNVV